LDSTDKSFKGKAATDDRRQAERHIFSATAEVVEMLSGARLQVRAADLSHKGCYLDSLNPFAIGSKVRVRIRWDDTELTCTGVVRDSQPGMGMGIAFTDMDVARKALIESWIERLASSQPADFSSSPVADTPKLDQSDDLAVRLIDLLRKKGMLSSNDVASLLRNRIL
jgi:hypothetical protein